MIKNIAAILASCLAVSSCSGVPERLSFNLTGPKSIEVDSGGHAERNIPSNFFPIGLYHALSGTWHDQTFDLMQVQQAQFNTVHLWEGQDKATAARAAAAAGLHSIIHLPSDADIQTLKDEPLILGWYLDEEPSHLLADEASREALAKFQARREVIRQIDPRRPVFIIDGPHTSKVDDIWRRWAVVGDVSAHFNYPVTLRKMRSLTPPQRVAETVALARKLNEGKKSLWFVAQAFGGQERGWLMPTPAEYRAMIYSAVLQGATGIIVFAYDSFVLRDDGIVGVHPDPQAAYANDIDYNRDGQPAYVASAEEREAARTLWRTVVDVNGELRGLAPWIFSPTDTELPLAVDVLEGRGKDIVYVVKKKGGQRLLIMQNTGKEKVSLRLSLPETVLGLDSFFPDQPVVKEAGGEKGWRVQLDAYGVLVVNIEQHEGKGL